MRDVRLQLTSHGHGRNVCAVATLACVRVTMSVEPFRCSTLLNLDEQHLDVCAQETSVFKQFAGALADTFINVNFNFNVTGECGSNFDSPLVKWMIRLGNLDVTGTSLCASILVFLFRVLS